MKSSDRDHLLRNVLADEALEQARATSLEAMLRSVRRRRQRRALVTGGAATLVVALSLAVLIQRWPAGARDEVSSPTTPAPAVRTISDEQLLALFADRSVALVGRDGAQQLLFFDAPKSAGR